MTDSPREIGSSSDVFVSGLQIELRTFFLSSDIVPAMGEIEARCWRLTKEKKAELTSHLHARGARVSARETWK